MKETFSNFVWPVTKSVTDLVALEHSVVHGVCSHSMDRVKNFHISLEKT